MSINNFNKRKSGVLIASAFTLLILGVGAIRIAQRGPSTPAPVAAAVPLTADVGKVGDLTVSREALELAEIRFTSAGMRTVAEKLPISGNIEAGGDRIVSVTPRVGGKAVSVSAVVGDSVHAGQTLGLIESNELAQAQAAYRQARSRVALTRNNLTRQRKLADLGVFGQPRVEEARREANAAQGEVNVVRNEISAARNGINEVRSEKSSLQGELAAARSGVASARKGVAVSISEVAKSRSGVTSAQGRVAKTRSDVLQAQTELAEAQSLAVEAEGAVRSQRSAILQAQTKLKTIESRFRRVNSLLADGLVSKADWEQVKNDNDVALADVDAARAGLAQAEARVEASRSHAKSAQSQIEAARAEVNTALAEVESAKTQVESARSQVGAAESQVETALANVQTAQGRLAQSDSKIKSAQAQMAQVVSRLDTAQKRAVLARQVVERELAVYRGGYSTSKEIIEAEAALSQADMEQQAAAESVQLLGGTPGGGSTIALVSPIAGRIQARDISPGGTVTAEDAVFKVMNLGLVWAQLAVPPRDLSLVRMGQVVTLTSESAPGRSWTGRVSSLGDAADETTRAVRIRVALSNKGEALRPQTFVRGHITTDVRRQRVTVPLEALQEHTGKSTVYVVKNDTGAFEVRHVKLGVNGSGWREIVSGLRQGDAMRRKIRPKSGNSRRLRSRHRRSPACSRR